MDTDTIAAVATPAGAGGIGVVKISGTQAIPIALPLFQPSRILSNLRSHHLYHGCIIDTDTKRPVDEVLFSVMRAPNTYTREDVVEIQAHGSRSGLGVILELVLKRGARLAEPGEFTKRAFLNGRIDLSQAEAVIEMVKADTAEAAELAARLLRGDLLEAIQATRAPIESLFVEVEAAIDFPEEVDEIIAREESSRNITDAVIKPLRVLLDGYRQGHIYREGVTAIIIGCPNVGKSSLMNRLLQRERAIVTAVPGTTRDFIEETVNIGGIPLRIVDTAGLHDTENVLEAEGIRFTRQRLDDADIVLFVVDCSVPLSDNDVRIYELVRNRQALLVVNKIDLDESDSAAGVVERFGGLDFVKVSALYNRGIDDLKKAVFREITHQSGPAELPSIVPNLRQKAAVEKALAASREVAEGLVNGRAPELIAVDLREALDSLGEIIGAVTTEEILDQVFCRFCIGK